MRTANTLVLFLSIAGGIIFALAGWYIATQRMLYTEAREKGINVPPR